MPTGEDRINWFEYLTPPRFFQEPETFQKVPSHSYATWQVTPNPEKTDPFVKNTLGLLQVAVPGATKEEVSITLENNILTVSLNPKEGSKAWHKIPTKWKFRLQGECEFKAEFFEGVLSIKIDPVKKNDSMTIPIS